MGQRSKSKTLESKKPKKKQKGVRVYSSCTASWPDVKNMTL